MAVAGLVLAAGAGRRYGAPKALVRPDTEGLTWVEQAVCRVADAGLGLVVVVVGAEADDVSDVLMSGAWALHRSGRHRVGVHIQECDDWQEGMGASLRAGLDAADDLSDDADLEAVLVTLVDLPDVTEVVHRRLLAAARGEERAAVARAAYRGRPGHPVLIGRDHWPAVRESAVGDRGARDFLARHETRLVECGDLATGRDVDTPGDSAQD